MHAPLIPYYIMSTKFVTFGEILLRFSKEDHCRLPQGRRFVGNYGGSEANVAVSLATLGEQVEFVTRLPDTPLGKAARMKLNEYNVGTQHILYGGKRLGTYYFEEAAAMRNSLVIYDRANSSYYSLKPQMLDWEHILKDADVFHASGITAAISQDSADATVEALDTADRMKKTISCDINYRKNLWKYGADPKETLGRMLQYSDIVFGDKIEYEFMTGRTVPFEAMDENYELDLDLYKEWFEEIHARWPRCQRWLMGIRNQVSSSQHTLTALLWTHGKMLSTRIYTIPNIVDPMGVGDAFMAAILHAVNTDPNNDQYSLDYSLAAAALKNSISGDFNLSTDEEIKGLIESRLEEDIW